MDEVISVISVQQEFKCHRSMSQSSEDFTAIFIKVSMLKSPKIFEPQELCFLRN